MSENLLDGATEPGPEKLDRLRAEVDLPSALADQYNAELVRRLRAEAECDDLRARLAKVERALMQGGQTDRVRWCAAVDALASVPEPSDSEPTEAEKIIARFDAMTQEEHEAGIAAARERAAERDNVGAVPRDRP